MDMTVRMSAMTMTVQDSTNMGLVKAPAAVVNVSESLRRNSTMAMIWNTVLALPYQLAAMTVPLLAATMRMPETMNSRARMMSTGQPGSTASSTRAMSAAVTRILSARGSMNFPKSVTSPRLRARYPSIQSVQEMRMKIPAAMTHFASMVMPGRPTHSGQGLRIASTKTGTRQMRMSVTMFAGVQSLSGAVGWMVVMAYSPSIS